MEKGVEAEGRVVVRVVKASMPKRQSPSKCSARRAGSAAKGGSQEVALRERGICDNCRAEAL